MGSSKCTVHNFLAGRSVTQSVRGRRPLFSCRYETDVLVMPDRTNSQASNYADTSMYPALVKTFDHSARPGRPLVSGISYSLVPIDKFGQIFACPNLTTKLRTPERTDTCAFYLAN